MSESIAILGSGPTAIAAALALKDQNITIIDAGKTEAATPKQSIKKTIPDKLYHGSTLPYDGAKKWLGSTQTQTDINSSLAKSGLSLVWGASMLPATDTDISTWPVTTKDLSSHYKEILKELPYAAKEDNLAKSWPLYYTPDQALKPSKQAQKLLEIWKKNQDHLRDLQFGESRLAVEAKNCTYCKKCLHGCPDDLIYKTESTLKALCGTHNISYMPNHIIESISESNNKVQLSTKSTTLEFDRLYLAAGTFHSSKLLAQHLKLTELTFEDNHYFILPALNHFKTPSAHTEEKHTLSELYLEYVGASHTTHLQLYTHNDHLTKEIKSKLGPFYPLLKSPATALENRLSIIQGFLHSEDSPKIKMTLKDNKAIFSKLPNPKTTPCYKQVLKALKRQKNNLGMTPLPFLAKQTLPGRSFHSGGSFPMQKTPNAPTHTDIYGRPKQKKRIHIIDASILPTIPATTITLTTMANAHRIASEYNKYAENS